eukprot:jgi/Hompol1/6458/HPOL_004987-RA
MNTLKRLLDFSAAMEHMIVSYKGKQGAIPVASFPEFVSKMIESLLTDLELKSKGYKKATLTTLFLLNNYHYILKAIKNCKLGEIVSAEVIDAIEKLIKKQLDIVTTLTKQQREVVKEKFRGFNKDFDEMYQTQKAYAIPDIELRAQVVKEVKQVLLPMYNRFYDRYTDTEFTKNREKYIKYDKDALAAALSKFFDASA